MSSLVTMDKYVVTSKRLRDEDPSEDWQLPKRTAPQKPSPTKLGVETSNRFRNLTVEQSSQLPEPLRDAVTKRKNPQRIPPIIIVIQEGWTHGKIKDAIEKINKNFHLQYKGRNRVAVQSYSSDAHEAIKKGLKAENISFHTFTRKDEKLSKVVIKGLPAYILKIRYQRT